MTLTPIAIGFPNPIGIDYYQPTKEIVMSVNYPGGIPNNFDIVASLSHCLDEVGIKGLDLVQLGKKKHEPFDVAALLEGSP